MSTDSDLLWGIAFTFAVLGVLGGWFYACGRADRARQVRAFARSTVRYAGVGFALGLAFLTSDLGTAVPEGRLGLVAVTVCCFLLLYAAVTAMVASDDEALVVVNLTGRPLLLTDPELAPFYTLPAIQEEPATVLPPVRPRTCYVVSPELGRLGAQAGRTDIFVVDAATATGLGESGPLRVRRLLRAVPDATPAERPGSGTRT